MDEPRTARSSPPGRSMPPARPVPGAASAATRPQRVKPDPNPLRVMIGLAGIASASALLTALLPSINPAQVSVVDAGTTSVETAVGPQPSVVHVTEVVTLAPGQTAPPNTAVVVQPQPTPRVRVKVVTQQSGTP